MALVSTTGAVEASVIVGNRSAVFGGGVYAQGGQAPVWNTLVRMNQSGWVGADLWRGWCAGGGGECDSGGERQWRDWDVLCDGDSGEQQRVGERRVDAGRVGRCSTVWYKEGWSNGSAVLDVDPLFVAR